MDIVFEKLYTQIETELEFCDPSVTPVICANLDDPENKALVIRTIADTAIQGRLQIDQAIAEVERLYSNNDLD